MGIETAAAASAAGMAAAKGAGGAALGGAVVGGLTLSALVVMLLPQLVTLGALTGARKTAILAALPEAT